MAHYAVATGAGGALIRVTGSGRAMALPELVALDRAPDPQTMAMTGIAATARIGVAVLNFQPYSWNLAVAGSAGGIVVRAGSQQQVAIPGGLIRGVDLGLQTMTTTGIASPARIGGVLLRRAGDSKLVIAGGGEWPGLLAGNAGYHTAVPGAVIRLPGIVPQVMTLSGILAPLRLGAVTLTLGRATYRFDTPGVVPANPIATI